MITIVSRFETIVSPQSILMSRRDIRFKKGYCIPTAEELREAHNLFERMEPRALFYRAALELVGFAWDGRSSLSVAQAVAVLLKTWNQSFYRFRKFDEEHLFGLEALVKTYRGALNEYRQRGIESLGADDELQVRKIFEAFEKLLYPVGTAKCLHLLAPRFFPLWDRAIATSYGLSLGRVGENAERYWAFMQISKEQVQRLKEDYAGSSLLKNLDEYNYCVYTKRLSIVRSV